MYEDDDIRPSTILKWALIVLVACLALDWIVMGNQFFMYKFFAPQQEAARRQVYENSKAYHQGSVQRLGSLCTQIDAADPDHKGMLQELVKHEFAEWDTKDVPEYLRPCLATARAQ